jgi:hypothetical protein
LQACSFIPPRKIDYDTVPPNRVARAGRPAVDAQYNSEFGQADGAPALALTKRLKAAAIMIRIGTEFGGRALIWRNAAVP